MGKRKSRKIIHKKPVLKLDHEFNCPFCNNTKTINVKINQKTRVANLWCRVCAAHYSSPVNKLSEPIDIYSEWIDACVAANTENYTESEIPEKPNLRKPQASFGPEALEDNWPQKTLDHRSFAKKPSATSSEAYEKLEAMQEPSSKYPSDEIENRVTQTSMPSRLRKGLFDDEEENEEEENEDALFEPLDEEPIEDEILEDEVLEDEALEFETIDDEALENEVLEDEALEDEALEDEPLERNFSEKEPLLHKEKINAVDLTEKAGKTQVSVKNALELDSLKEKFVDEEGLEAELFEEERYEEELIENEQLKNEAFNENSLDNLKPELSQTFSEAETEKYGGGLGKNNKYIVNHQEENTQVLYDEFSNESSEHIMDDHDLDFDPNEIEEDDDDLFDNESDEQLAPYKRQKK